MATTESIFNEIGALEARAQKAEARVRTAEAAAAAAAKKSAELEAAATAKATATLTAHGGSIAENTNAGEYVRSVGTFVIVVAHIVAVRAGDFSGVDGSDELLTAAVDRDEDGDVDMYEVLLLSGTRLLVTWTSAEIAKVRDQLGRTR
jgi:hypothetical protein